MYFELRASYLHHGDAVGKYTGGSVLGPGKGIGDVGDGNVPWFVHDEGWAGHGGDKS
jgi:hypothetical protein